MFSINRRKFHSLLLTPALLPVLLLFNYGASNNHPLNAFDATYTVHGTLNGSFPFSDPIRLISNGPVAHGTLRTFGNFNGFSQDSFIYEPAYGYVGADSFTYHACDSSNNCVDGTINLDVVNAAPDAVDDRYTVHGVLYGRGDSHLTNNDSDSDGDSLRVVSVTSASHGRLTYDFEYDAFVYAPDYGFTGTASANYQACDNFGLCDTATVTFDVVNGPPAAGDDRYDIRGTTTVGPLRENDSDPDQADTLVSPVIISGPAHGTLATLPDPDLKSYQPNPGYLGSDSFVYQVCDNLGLCDTATVTLSVLVDDRRENSGTASCNSTVGGPINVTNGNMYLQQSDYQLPGIGPAINITRTYNSFSPDVGLFGRGWSSDYDEAIKVYNSTYVRWFSSDGRATNFMRSTGSGPFAPVEGDFYGSLTQNGDGSFTVSFKGGSLHRFSSAGKLLSLVDISGNQTTLGYAGGKLASITDPFGRVVTATTDSGGRVTTLTDGIGKFATYAYGASGQLLSVTYADNSKFQFAYTTANGNLVLATVTDALGNILENHSYDAQGRALTSEKQGGVERYSLSFVSETETDVTDALGHVSKYFYDQSKGRHVVTQIQGLCNCGGGSQTQSWTYDNQLNMTSHTNALGQTATYTYDANGNQLTATGVLGTSSFTYNQFGEVLSATDAMGGITTNTYDGAGKLLSVEDALDHTTTFTYDPRGQLLTMTNPLGKITTLTWDTSGRLTQTKDALNNNTTYVYDARARLIKATDALANATSFAYDGANRLIKVTRADNSVISYTYDLAGRRTKTTDPLKNVTSFAYDGAYRLTSATDALNKSVTYTYDLMSNLTGATDQLGHTTNIGYDELNRPKTTVYPPAVAGGTRLQETIEYDAGGNVVKRTDTAARVTTLEYDNANRLIKVTDPALQITQYEYNARSNVTALVDALGQRYEFAYDTLSRVTSATRAGVQMSFAYDEAGNLIQRTDYNNMPTGYTYDALNRLTNITYPDATTATYAYDKLSRLTSAANLNGTVSFVYDKMGRVTSTTDVWGQATSYTYDVNGRRTQTSLGSAKFATYVYDAVNRPTKITDNGNKNTSYTYDAASNLLTRTLSNGVVSTYSYDGMDRLIRLKDAKGTTVIADNNYSYNNANQIIQNLDQSGAHVYGYDALDRLTAASHPATGNESYAYDGVGNRTSSHRSAVYGYQPNNRLMSTDTGSYLYDSNGNMTGKSDSAGTTQFVWDFENRLTNVVTPSAGVVAYKYDALGRRIQRTPSSGISTNFSYDGADVVRDKNSDATTVDYLNGPGVDNKIWQKGAAQYFFSQDHLGSTTALTNPSGALIERETYDAYGDTSGSGLTRYGYTGRERDSVTGLMYYRARWYDAQLGRFISEDPIGLAGGVNQFSYVGNNPQNGKDPTGLYEIDVHYYLTYFFALKTGCFTADEARLIADADQATDENDETKPAFGLTEQQRTQNREYHDLQPGNHEGQGSPELWQQAMNGPTNYVGLGRYLHFLQDSFSHAGYESDVNGHLSGGHYYDKTDSDVPRALRMAGATWNALNEYAMKKKCGCRGKWDSSWWQQVVDFSNAPGANFGALETIDSNGELENLGMTNNRLYLLQKIRILSLSPR